MAAAQRFGETIVLGKDQIIKFPDGKIEIKNLKRGQTVELASSLGKVVLQFAGIITSTPEYTLKELEAMRENARPQVQEKIDRAIIVGKKKMAAIIVTINGYQPITRFLNNETPDAFLIYKGDLTDIHFDEVNGELDMTVNSLQQEKSEPES